MSARLFARCLVSPRRHGHPLWRSRSWCSARHVGLRKRIEPGLPQAYQAARKANEHALSVRCHGADQHKRCLWGACCHWEPAASRNEEIAVTDIYEAMGKLLFSWQGGRLALLLDRGLLTKAIIFGVARRV
ncbi:hypothetical protein HPP92_003117 [Vanilla planifolia]|uniref:Uncharacterized protein n=1 Tax=Vanilla planifolia TaxID=51239 RepID=A0A835S2F2_VANPL|nr:hypothetical protein HPP92_003117 [Vanilla planifolia]